MKTLIKLSTFLFLVVLTTQDVNARIGGGRSFGNRGSRGFVAPRSSVGNTYRPSGNYQNSYSQPYQTPQYNSPRSTPPSTGSVFLKSLGAGIAGGMIGGMISRAIGGGNVGHSYSPGAGGMGGIGFIEILLIGGLIYLLFRLFTRKSEVAPSSHDGAAALMRKARSDSWNDSNTYGTSNSMHSSSNVTSIDSHLLDSTPINSELAMDLFFKIQGAWANRDLSSVRHLLDMDARDYLDRELVRLKSNRQINRLENIAVRSTEVMETWRESNQEFSTVRILASLLDYTVDENSQQVLEGSKTDPVKFEEFWTFSRDIGSSSWKLSAIQQI